MADLFPPDQRAKWSGLFGLVYGVSNLFGPTIGGWLAEHGPLMGNLVTDSTRWRWVFYINLPVGVIALVALLIFLPANLSVRTSAWASALPGCATWDNWEHRLVSRLWGQSSAARSPEI